MNHLLILNTNPKKKTIVEMLLNQAADGLFAILSIEDIL